MEKKEGDERMVGLYSLGIAATDAFENRIGKFVVSNEALLS